MLHGFGSGGGTANAGVAFNFDPATDADNVLYSFKTVKHDCNSFTAPVIQRKLLYGTGMICGSMSHGDVFSVNANTGDQFVLHSFTGGTDGSQPSDTVQWKGVLYGVATYSSPNYAGTIFSVTP